MSISEDTAVGPNLDFNPMIAPHRQNPHLFYAEARKRKVAISPTLGMYVITRYEDLMTVVNDPGTYSSSVAIPRIYDNPAEVVAELRGVPETSMLVNEDEPLHRAVRKVFEPALSARRIRELTPLMRDTANSLIDSFESAENADLHSQFASPFVRKVLSAIIGFPVEDSAQVQRWSDDQAILFNPLAPTEEKVDAAREMRAYTDYLQELINARKIEPTGDLISCLVHGTDKYPPLSNDQVHTLVRGSRVAGYDTTRDSILSTLLLMLRDRELWEAVRSDSARMLPRIMEEALRRDAPHRGLLRLATRETELGGASIPRGAVLFLLFGAGNRDDRMFPEPDSVKLDRPNVRKHLAFGDGLHRCPGEPTARVEIRVAIQTIMARLPGLHLAPDFHPEYVASFLFRGLESLRVLVRGGVS